MWDKIQVIPIIECLILAMYLMIPQRLAFSIKVSKMASRDDSIVCWSNNSSYLK